MSDFFAPSYWYGAGPGAAFSSVNNAVAQNQANMIPNMNANMAYVAAQNQAAMAAAQPKPPGYGFVPIATFGMSSPAAVAASNASRGITPNARAVGNANRAAAGWAPIGTGGIGSDAARAPDQPPILSQYRGPASYGWTHNEGAPAPAAPQVYSRGEFNPQTYGWDHNEGATAPPAAPPSTFNDRFNFPYAPRKIESPYGPGGYPPMEPRVPGQGANAGSRDAIAEAMMANGGYLTHNAFGV